MDNKYLIQDTVIIVRPLVINRFFTRKLEIK